MSVEGGGATAATQRWFHLSSALLTEWNESSYRTSTDSGAATQTILKYNVIVSWFSGANKRASKIQAEKRGRAAAACSFSNCTSEVKPDLFPPVMTDKTDLARPYHYEPYPAKPNNASSLKRNEIKTSSNASSLIHNPTKHKSERSSKCCCCTISSRSATFWTSFLTNLGICTLLFGYTLLGEFRKKRQFENCSVVANLLVFLAADCCWLSVMCEVSHSHSRWNEVSGELTFKLVELNYSSRANGESVKLMHSLYNTQSSRQQQEKLVGS